MLSPKRPEKPRAGAPTEWVEATRARIDGLTDRTPEWLSSLREQGIEHFTASGFPTRRDEEWRYTNVKPIVEGPFRTPLPEATATVDVAPFTCDALSGPRMVFVDGIFRDDLSDLSSLPDGVTVERMTDAVARNAPGLEESLSRHPEGSHPFHALNTACFADGAYVHAAPKARGEAPIHVLCIGGVGGAGASHLRHFFHVEPDARIAVVEEYRSPADSGGKTETLTNAVTDVFVARRGHLDRVKIAQEDHTAHHIAYLSVLQESDSVFHDTFFAVGGGTTRNEIEALLDGEEVECTINGLYHLDGARQVDNHTLLRHAKPNCRSWEMYRGVLDGKSRGIFTGKIHVYEDAQKTDAKQNSNSLLLSRDAEADTRPRLEIHADDVRCTHGATVGELDESAMFYLRSRGISEIDARHMLVHAFAGEVLDPIEDDALRAELATRLATSLARARAAHADPTGA